MVCIGNFFLRFMWAANFFPFFARFHPATLIFIIEIVEVFRRWIWIIFRVEWEIIVQTERGLLKDKDDDEATTTLLNGRTNGEK
jgi:EXS family